MFWFVFRRGFGQRCLIFYLGGAAVVSKKFSEIPGNFSQIQIFFGNWNFPSCPEAFFLRIGKQKSRRTEPPVMKNGFLANQDSTLMKNK